MTRFMVPWATDAGGYHKKLTAIWKLGYNVTIWKEFTWYFSAQRYCSGILNFRHENEWDRIRVWTPFLTKANDSRTSEDNWTCGVLPCYKWLLSPSGTSRVLIRIEGFCSVQTNLSMIAIFCHLNLLHDSSQSFETYFNIVLPCTFKSNESFLLLGFSTTFCLYFKSLLYVRHGNLDRPPWLITFICLRLSGTYSKQ